MKYEHFINIYLKIIIVLFSIFSLNLKSYAFRNENCNLVKTSSQNKYERYVLGPGDLVSVNVFSNNFISGDYEILNDGTISFPMIGPINIDGLNLIDATKKLEKLLEDELFAPGLEVTLKTSRPLSISVVGEINRPGVYKLEKENTFRNSNGNVKTYTSLPRLFDAITEAGGVTSEADIKNVCLIRKGQNLNKDKIYYKLNLQDVLITGSQENNPYLFDEDIIEISEIKENLVKENEFLQSSLAPEFIRINIVGEVNIPGSKEIKNNSTLLDAISEAGGTTFLTSRGYAEILRVKSNGKVARIKYSFNLNDVNKSIFPRIVEGDTILIARNKIAKTTSFLMKISEPLYNIFRVLEINKDLKN